MLKKQVQKKSLHNSIKWGRINIKALGLEILNLLSNIQIKKEIKTHIWNIQIY